ncbi:hypothetical protein M2454_000706 [Aequitasia blattaphilus]|uniref:Uncharacterized protein n=1 Tax=Aequitasia blattaphilus TaxID=2949332 RepID=A0ABT1E800_9FIRM|nr:hypothetical protein [Aequitasia blattaphilus]MCP1101913.1 hypothetical protein [Aequitasia blattaphilus]MCR8614553.1 hypothetical protein [Aequitasia blattaphilus]
MEKYISIKSFLRYILIIVMSVAAVGAAATYFGLRQEARTVLGQAKSIQLCLNLLSIQAIGEDEYIVDSAQTKRISKWAEEELNWHMDENVKINLIYFYPKNNGEIKFYYSKNGFQVIVEGDNDYLNAYRVYYRGFTILKNKAG